MGRQSVVSKAAIRVGLKGKVNLSKGLEEDCKEGKSRDFLQKSIPGKGNKGFVKYEKLTRRPV